MTIAKKEERVTKNIAIRAFEYAVCQSSCKEGDKAKSTRCIVEKRGCDIRNNFIKKLD